MTGSAWVEIHGQHAGDAIFVDDNGPARVPLADLDDLHRRATRTGRAVLDGRVFDRDVIAAVRRDWKHHQLLPLDSCGTSGCDQAGPFTHGRIPACHSHATPKD